MYSIEFTEQAKTDLGRLDKLVAQRIFKKIRWLAENLDDISPEPLAGEWQSFYKLRVGDYRAIYAIQRGQMNLITVHFIRHRREVYKLK
jgi:mRNA interferase RelE/StbE